MKKFFIAAILCTALLCGCSGNGTDEISESGETVTSEETVTTATGTQTETTPATTTKATTTTANTETTVTEEVKEEIILTPIPSGAAFEVLSCEITESGAAEKKDDFPDKEVLKRAREICFADEEIHKIIIESNEERAEERRIETAEDISFICGLRYDFDGDGEYEHVISLQYCSTPVGMGGAFVIYMDGDKYEILANGENPVFAEDIKIITSGGFKFLMLTTTGGFISYSCDIYGFGGGMPERVINAINDDYGYEKSKSFKYENGIFYLSYKYDCGSYPFVLCGDGVFRQLGREKISREDFESHVQNGGAYLDSLAENGEEITEIYTYGYFNYLLCGEGVQYYVYGRGLGDNGGSFETEKWQSLPNETWRFTDEVVYGDVWAAEYRSGNYDIGGGYACYISENSKILNVVKDNIITDSMMLGAYNFLPDWQIKFYDMDVPPHFALKKSGLEYRTYFVIDGKITEMNWTLDGERLDAVDYTMLPCRGESGGGFVSYSLPIREDDRFTKRHFTFAEGDYANIVGYTEDMEDKLTKKYVEYLGYERHTIHLLDSGENARIAYETLSKFVNFWGTAYSDRDFAVMDENELWGRIEKEGFRTREELLDTLSDFCTSAAADEAYSMLIEIEYSDFNEIDGRFYLRDGPPSNYLPRYFIESAEEKDGVVTAKIFAYYAGQDVPYRILPPLYAEFVREGGVWKISSLPKEKI